MDKNFNPPKVGYVVETTQRAAVVWKCVGENIEGQRAIRLDHTSKARYEYWYITDPKNYYCAEVEAIPPAMCKEKVFGRGRGIVGVLAYDKTCRLPSFSAHHGFAPMRVPFLKKFYVSIECPTDPMPRLEGALVETLIKFICPNWTPEGLVEAMSKRKGKKLPLFDSALKLADVVADAGDALDHNDRDALLEAHKDYINRIDAMKVAAAALKPAKKAGAKKSKKKKNMAPRTFCSWRRPDNTFLRELSAVL